MNYSGEKSNKSIPVVTVYIPCKDYGHYLHVAVKSVLAQLFTDWELLIIDEASTDDTTIIAKQFVQKHPDKIKLITNDKPQGLQRIANQILKIAQGRYIVRLDADDWFDECALLLMAAKLESDSELGLVYGNYFYTDPSGKVIGVERRHKLWIEDVSGHLPPHGACTMIRTRTLKSVGGYSEDVDAQDGWDLWFKLVNRVKVANLEAPLFYYRQHEKSLSRDTERLFKARSIIMSKLRSKLEGNYTPSCLAVLPVKESYPGFEGVPYRKFGEKSMLEWAINSAQRAKGVTEVAVSTESPTVLEFADRLVEGGKVQPHFHVLRPSNLTGTYIPLREIMLHIGQAYFENSGRYPDIMVYLSLHSPLREPFHVDNAINTLLIMEADSVVSVCEEREPIFSHGHDGLKLLNPGRFNNLTYERERFYQFNGAVLAVWWEILRQSDLFGQRIGYVEMTAKESFQVKRSEDLR